MKAKPCKHTRKELCTEPDGCYWLACLNCSARGPKRHSATLAIVSAKNNIRKR
jgi:hypothetical protein